MLRIAQTKFEILNFVCNYNILMKELVESFPSQLKEAIEIGRKASLSAASHEIKNVVISGLGGSGIGGTIAAELTAKEATVPILVNKDYFLPAYVNENSLVIISSYSGNTEETLNAMDIAIERGAKIVCVSSGGKVIDKAQALGFDHIIIPEGKPPRACLGYSLTQLFYVLNHFEIISGGFEAQLEKAITLLENDKEDIIQKAENITEQLHQKLPILYAPAGYEGVAVRFRQQLNENSKILCWHHVIPEMNHNELVGWRDENHDLAVVIFRNDDDYERVKSRIEINEGVFAKYTPNIIELFSKGDSAIEKSLYLIHLCDWVSCFLADKRGVDAVEVKVIDHLKGELAKL